MVEAFLSLRRGVTNIMLPIWSEFSNCFSSHPVKNKALTVACKALQDLLPPSSLPLCLFLTLSPCSLCSWYTDVPFVRHFYCEAFAPVPPPTIALFPGAHVACYLLHYMPPLRETSLTTHCKHFPGTPYPFSLLAVSPEHRIFYLLTPKEWNLL